MLLVATIPMAACKPDARQDTAINSQVDHDALIAARADVWRAYFEADSIKLVQLLPEQMVAMGKDRSAIIRDAQGFVASGGRFVGITFSDDEFYVRGDVALVFSKYAVALTQQGKPTTMRGRAIELFEKRDGRWINPSWHLDDDERQP
ncbi:MAG: nuclear transport factor 2 family protein [Gemmatimonadaceae bacterium]|nr:nuclear transport factor 2 family protein [Gemmatimonadaceae bacterium]